MIGLDRTLGAIVEHVGRLKEVRKAELHFGDWVLVTTANSTYSIRVLEDGLYSQLICQNCGYVMLFAARPIGLVT